MFKTEWSGSYPTLCYGSWKLTYNGVEVELPEEMKSSSMGTIGIYSSWHFEGWSEVFEDYSDGLNESSWIEKHRSWVVPILEKACIPTNDETLANLFSAFQENDWRHSSCGGCI